jgi:hypothetical protein
MELNDRATICNNLFQHARKYRESVKDSIWQQNAEYLWGDQNIRRTTEGDQNDFVYNIYYKDFNSFMALMCRSEPSFAIDNIYDSLASTKSVVNDCINQIYYDNDIGVRMVELCSMGGPFGTAYIKSTWDKSMRMGLGGIRLQIPDTRNIYFMPGISRVRDSLVMFERRYVDKLTALSLYPDQAEAITALFSNATDAKNYSGVAAPSGPPIYINVEGTISQTYLNQTSSMTSEKQMIELVETWFIDETTVQQVPKLFDEIKKTGRYKKATLDEQAGYANTRIYPRGRLKVHSGNYEFDDRPNPFPSFPYTQYVNFNAPAAKPGDELPMGEFDQLMEVQDMFNTRSNQIMDAMDNTAFGGFGITDGMFDVDEFEAKPRRVYTSNRLGNFQWINPAAIPPEAFKSQGDIFSLGDQLQNRQNVMSGKTGDLRSGDAVDTLVDIADRSMITRTLSLEACLVANVRYNMSMVGAFYIPGVHYPDGIDLKGLSPDGYKITVRAGMNLPSSKQASSVLILQMLDHGVIDPEAVLENTDASILPNKEQILARMRSKWAAQEQAANQQASVDQNQQNADAQASMAKVIPMQPQGAQ